MKSEKLFWTAFLERLVCWENEIDRLLVLPQRISSSQFEAKLSEFQHMTDHGLVNGFMTVPQGLEMGRKFSTIRRMLQHATRASNPTEKRRMSRSRGSHKDLRNVSLTIRGANVKATSFQVGTPCP